MLYYLKNYPEVGYPKCFHWPAVNIPLMSLLIMNTLWTICWAGCYRCKSLLNCFAPGSDIDHGEILERQAFRWYSPLFSCERSSSRSIYIHVLSFLELESRSACEYRARMKFFQHTTYKCDKSHKTSLK